MLTVVSLGLFHLHEGIVVLVGTFWDYVMDITRRRPQYRQDMFRLLSIQTLIDVNDQ